MTVDFKIFRYCYFDTKKHHQNIRYFYGKHTKLFQYYLLNLNEYTMPGDQQGKVSMNCGILYITYKEPHSKIDPICKKISITKYISVR